MSQRPRFLILGDAGSIGTDWLRHCGLEGDVVHAGSWDDAVNQLRSQRFDVIAANPNDLHTLELLQAEMRSMASRSVEAIGREVALSVDDILTSATSMLERYIGHDAELADKIRRIIADARALKQCIQKVGEEMAPSNPTAPPAAAPPDVKGLRVLVADNDDRVRRSAHGLLGRWGCIVETARDGREALTMARLGAYDVILADIRLPDITGDEVYRRLREAQPQARVILMTGYGYDPSHALVKARQDGLRFMLFKPFRVDQLRDALTLSEPRP